MFNLEMEWNEKPDCFIIDSFVSGQMAAIFWNVPNTDSRIFEFVVKTERTNIYCNYNICALDIVSQPFNPP